MSSSVIYFALSYALSLLSLSQLDPSQAFEARSRSAPRTLRTALPPGPGRSARGGAQLRDREGRAPFGRASAARALPGRWRCSRLRRSRLLSELRCEEPPRVRHIGARAAAAAPCSSVSSRRGPAEPDGGGDVGAAGREAGARRPRAAGRRRKRAGPASLRARPLRHPPWRGGPAAPERGAHAQSEPSPGPAAISREKPPGPRLGRDMEAVKAFNSEVRAPSRAFPRGRGAGGALGPGAFPAPSRCARLAAGRGRNRGAAAGQPRPAGAGSGLPREGHRGAAGAAVRRAGGGGRREKLPEPGRLPPKGCGRRREEGGGGGWGQRASSVLLTGGKSGARPTSRRELGRAGHFLARSAPFSDPLAFSGTPSHFSCLIVCPHPASVHLGTSLSCLWIGGWEYEGLEAHLRDRK